MAEDNCEYTYDVTFNGVEETALMDVEMYPNYSNFLILAYKDKAEFTRINDDTFEMAQEYTDDIDAEGRTRLDRAEIRAIDAYNIRTGDTEKYIDPIALHEERAAAYEETCFIEAVMKNTKYTDEPEIPKADVDTIADGRPYNYDTDKFADLATGEDPVYADKTGTVDSAIWHAKTHGTVPDPYHHNNSETTEGQPLPAIDFDALAEARPKDESTQEPLNIAPDIAENTVLETEPNTPATPEAFTAIKTLDVHVPEGDEMNFDFDNGLNKAKVAPTDLDISR